jgi:DNA-binding NarL/FixJ family response regulator
MALHSFKPTQPYMSNQINIALADDHVLLRKGLSGMISQPGYNVVFEADNGLDLIEKMGLHPEPDLVLMDINMPRMDGYETTAWLRKNHPLVRVLALSMYDDENAIIRMIKNGARGYILKDSETQELKAAIGAVMTKGFYYSELLTGKLIHSVNQVSGEDTQAKSLLKLTEREIEFIKLVCTEMTYKSIAAQLHLSPRTIDGYRDDLFEKLHLKTRVGLVIYAIKNGIVHT